MTVHIENECLPVVFSNKGGEMMSIRRVDGTEYLWAGRSEILDGHPGFNVPTSLLKARGFCARGQPVQLKNRDDSKLRRRISVAGAVVCIFPSAACRLAEGFLKKE
jgi:hypothetical protein